MRDFGLPVCSSQGPPNVSIVPYVDRPTATGYVSQHIWCLSQARINWEGCTRKGTRHKMEGMSEVGALISWEGGQSIRIVGVSAFVIFTSLQKIQKMANKDI